MLNTKYRLTAPKRFEAVFEDEKIKPDTVVVRPTYLSVCHADQRYYQGKRPVEVLKKKLPMALIHEGIGRVVYSSSGKYGTGDRVVMIPNTPERQDEYIGENYLKESRFRSSGCDGYMQEFVYMSGDRVLPVAENIPDEVASFTELVSVSYHAVRRFIRFSHGRRERIGIWGDGNLGYITSLLVKKILPKSHVTVCGISEEKLSDFTFVDEVVLTDEITEKFYVDHALECVGGSYAEDVIAQIIKHINPEGTVALLGVSEMPPKIPTRMVLEKGIRMFGSSRSGREDFAGLLDLYKKDGSIPGYLTSLVNEVMEVKNIKDMTDVFEADARKQVGKIVMKWRG